MGAYLLLSHSDSGGVRQLVSQMQTASFLPVYHATLQTVTQTLTAMRRDGVTDVMVCPLFLTDGVLLRRLKAQIERFPFAVSFLPALAELPWFPQTLAVLFSLRANDVCLLLVHGTAQKQAYDPLVCALSSFCKAVHLVALHGEPSPETVCDALDGLTPGGVKCIPLFMTAGHHMKTDVPQLLKLLCPAAGALSWQPSGLCDFSVFRHDYIEQMDTLVSAPWRNAP